MKLDWDTLWYVLALIGALVVGWMLHRRGVDLTLLLMFAVSCWSGGVFFRVLTEIYYMRKQRSKE